MFLAACRSRDSLQGESSFGTDSREVGASCAVKPHFCDCHHITGAMAELASQLSIVPRMRFSRSTFLRNTEPRSRGAPFFATLESVLKTGRSSAETQAFPTSAYDRS